MRILDADGHIWESEAMFDRIDPEFYPRRPVLVSLPLDTEAGDANRVWMIESKAAPRISGRGATFPASFPGSPSAETRRVTLGAQTLENVAERLQGMDEFGIEEQVIFPTLFLESIVDDVRLEAACYRAYNDFVGGACAQSGGRLKWTACVPWRDPEAAVAEVRRAGDLGASGIFTMGVIFEPPGRSALLPGVRGRQRGEPARVRPPGLGIARSHPAVHQELLFLRCNDSRDLGFRVCYDLWSAGPLPQAADGVYRDRSPVGPLRHQSNSTPVRAAHRDSRQASPRAVQSARHQS